MKIRGKQKFNTPRKVVMLTRTTSEEGVEGTETVQIRVRALPMGIDQKMFELFPEPVKPQDWAKDAKGIILRDPETKKPMIADVETPEYRDAARLSMHNRMGYILFHGIDDPEVQFDVTEGQEKNAAFYSGVFQQLVDFGFTMGDLSRLVAEITSLMNLSEDVETAKGN